MAGEQVPVHSPSSLWVAHLSSRYWEEGLNSARGPESHRRLSVVSKGRKEWKETHLQEASFSSSSVLLLLLLLLFLLLFLLLLFLLLPLYWQGEERREKEGGSQRQHQEEEGRKWSPQISHFVYTITTLMLLYHYYSTVVPRSQVQPELQVHL